MATFIKGSHCSYCGKTFDKKALQLGTWPRQCSLCGNESYKNPVPVVVALICVIPKDGKGLKWLIQQRNIQPHKGSWALTGGFMSIGETYQQAIARECEEEVGIKTKPENFKLFDLATASNGNILIFSFLPIKEEEIMFKPNVEVSDIKLVDSPNDQELCFPTHNAMWRRYHGLIQD